MKVSGFLACAVLVTITSSSRNIQSQNSVPKAQLPTIDQLCGQLELATPQRKQIVVNGMSEVRLNTAYLDHATLKLYRHVSTEKQCCMGHPLAKSVSGEYGAFEFRGIKPGNYWLQVQKGK